MADTLAAYITRVRVYLKEPNPSNSYWAGQTALEQFFNAAYRRRCAQIQLAYEGQFVLHASIDLVANQDIYTWPTDFQRMNKLEIVRSDGTTYPIHRQERHYSANPGAVSSSQDSYYPTYRPVDQGFKLEPTPSFAVTGGLRIEYLGLPPRLKSTDTLSPDFPSQFDELLVLDAAMTAFQQEASLESNSPALYRSIAIIRKEWEDDFERYIETRITSPQFVEQFAPHYQDA